MALVDIWSKTNNWFKTHKLSKIAHYHSHIDNDGLIANKNESPQPPAQNQTDQENPVVVKSVPANQQNQSIEKLQNGFNKLVTQLENINGHLNRQATQHEELMGQMQKMPTLIEKFPAVVENQTQLVDQLISQLKATANKDQQFIETLEKIPEETAKQTDAMININHQLSAAAQTDVQMTENFHNFNDTLKKMDQTTLGQTDSIMQMSKTFATSDRYLKYLMSRQNKRFMWIFVTAIGVCFTAILILAGIIIYLNQ